MTKISKTPSQLEDLERITNMKKDDVEEQQSVPRSSVSKHLRKKPNIRGDEAEDTSWSITSNVNEDEVPISLQSGAVNHQSAYVR